jgi:pimeloyl-ACP methyl ester carboxylesterase
MLPKLHRRAALLALAASALLAACASTPPAASTPPIVFVHGNGDSAAVWTTTIWRFESNGWPRDRLVAIDLPYPLARDDDGKLQEGRTSTTEHMQFLAAEVEKVRKTSGADKVVLVGNSRGGNAIRNYIANGGGDRTVSIAVLGGTPNHGVWAIPTFAPGSEFNGSGPFLTALNAPKGPSGDEVTPGVRWLTIRSDGNDKYAQPDGVWIGAKGTPTNVTAQGPELKGATNKVLPGVDHRETSFDPLSFGETYAFIAGKAPATTAIVAEVSVVLDGTLSGLGLNNATGNYANNLPLVGATLEVFATDAATGERLGPALHRKTLGNDGRWGPFKADVNGRYEFVISAPGYATTHIYRSPFARSSNVVSLHAERLADADMDALSVVTLTRPRGYFGVPRDSISLDGMSPPAGIPSGVAGVSSSKLKVTDSAGRAVVAAFNGERIVGRAWPVAGNHVVLLELTY